MKYDEAVEQLRELLTTIIKFGFETDDPSIISIEHNTEIEQGITAITEVKIKLFSVLK